MYVVLWKCPEALVRLITCFARDFTNAIKAVYPYWKTLFRRQSVTETEYGNNSRTGQAELKNKMRDCASSLLVMG